MDVPAALAHAKAVGRELSSLGILNPEAVRAQYDAYAAVLARGLEGSFTRFLFARRMLDALQHAELDRRHPAAFLAPSRDASTTHFDAHPALETTAISAADLASVRGIPTATVGVMAQEVDSCTLWLECEPLPPIPVGPASELRIGRGDECDMVLPHQGVSRVHCVISSEGGALRLVDRSTYGTFVNAELIAQHTLESGDVISIGPYMIVVREDSPREEADDTLPFRIPGFPSEAMHGSLQDVSLAEVLQQLEFNEHSGTLRIRSGDRRGLLTFDAGRPVYAELGATAAQEAAFAMLGLAEGEFSFVRKDASGARNMAGVTVTGLLLEAGRQQDEQSTP